MANDDSRPERIQGLTGVVTRKLTAKGSKSERDAFWLENAEGAWILRRKDGPTYGDSQLGRYLGQRVSCDGFRTGSLVLTERIAPVPAEASKASRSTMKPQ